MSTPAGIQPPISDTSSLARRGDNGRPCRRVTEYDLIFPLAVLLCSVHVVASGVLDSLVLLVFVFRLWIRIKMQRVGWEDIWATVAFVCGTMNVVSDWVYIIKLSERSAFLGVTKLKCVCRCRSIVDDRDVDIHVYVYMSHVVRYPRTT
jgi:hypothetical protein